MLRKGYPVDAPRPGMPQSEAQHISYRVCDQIYHVNSKRRSHDGGKKMYIFHLPAVALVSSIWSVGAELTKRTSHTNQAENMLQLLTYIPTSLPSPHSLQKNAESTSGCCGPASYTTEAKITHTNKQNTGSLDVGTWARVLLFYSRWKRAHMAAHVRGDSLRPRHTVILHARSVYTTTMEEVAKSGASGLAPPLIGQSSGVGLGQSSVDIWRLRKNKKNRAGIFVRRDSIGDPLLEPPPFFYQGKDGPFPHT